MAPETTQLRNLMSRAAIDSFQTATAAPDQAAVEDVLDDGMCEKCADRLRRKLSERLRAWRVISAALAVSVVILAWRVLG